MDTQLTQTDVVGDVTQRRRIYGVTFDDVYKPAPVVESMLALPAKPWIRVVFDEGTVPADYVKSLDAFSAAGIPVLGELLDSSFVKDCDLACYQKRATDFATVLGNRVAVYEIGNEVNGEWLGPQMGEKIGAAYDVIHAKGYPTALTTYWCPDTEKVGTMQGWLDKNIPARVKTGVDYVLVSVYEGDCGEQPIPLATWEAAFAALGKQFPQASLGFGEVGIGAKDHQQLGTDAEKAVYLQRYYTYPITHPRYILGGFWWFGRQDMLPAGTPVWQALAAVMK